MLNLSVEPYLVPIVCFPSPKPAIDECIPDKIIRNINPDDCCLVESLESIQESSQDSPLCCGIVDEDNSIPLFNCSIGLLADNQPFCPCLPLDCRILCLAQDKYFHFHFFTLRNSFLMDSQIVHLCSLFGALVGSAAFGGSERFIM